MKPKLRAILLHRFMGGTHIETLAGELHSSRARALSGKRASGKCGADTCECDLTAEVDRIEDVIRWAMREAGVTSAPWTMEYVAALNELAAPTQGEALRRAAVGK